jgi:hypothetical protein
MGIVAERTERATMRGLTGGTKEITVVRREGDDSWVIEFEGTITVTDSNGRTHTECARQTWRFNQESGFVLTISFGTEKDPRVQLAGNDRTPAQVIGETIAATIRATSNPSATRGGREGA